MGKKKEKISRDRKVKNYILYKYEKILKLAKIRDSKLDSEWKQISRILQADLGFFK